MNEFQLYLCLALAGFVSHTGMLLFLKYGTTPIANLIDALKYRTFGNVLLNNRGEVAGGAGAGAGSTGEGGEKGGAGGTATFTQEKVNQIVEERLARERAKYGDVEELRKFKSEYEKNKSVEEQKKLEEGRQYEEAKKGYEGKIKDYEGKLADKDRRLTDLQISHALTNAISSQNGYVEESLALLRGNAVIEGEEVKIKAKDANGVDQVLPLSEGVKRFLSTKPHLVKAAAKGGSGTGAGAGEGSGAGSGGGAGETLESLNQQLADAIKARDAKAQYEIGKKIRLALTKKGVNI